MSTTEATYATHLHERLPSQPELHKPYIHVKALWRGKELPFDCGPPASAASWKRADPGGR